MSEQAKQTNQVSIAAVQLRGTLVSIAAAARKSGVPIDVVLGAYQSVAALLSMETNNALAEVGSRSIAVAQPGEVQNLKLRNSGQ